MDDMARGFLPLTPAMRASLAETAVLTAPIGIPAYLGAENFPVKLSERSLQNWHAQM